MKRRKRNATLLFMAALATGLMLPAVLYGAPRKTIIELHKTRWMDDGVNEILKGSVKLVGVDSLTSEPPTAITLVVEFYDKGRELKHTEKATVYLDKRNTLNFKKRKIRRGKVRKFFDFIVLTPKKAEYWKVKVDITKTDDNPIPWKNKFGISDWMIKTRTGF